MLDKFIILGYSGHAYSVIEGIQSNEQIILGYCESQKQKNNPFQSIKFLLNDSLKIPKIEIIYVYNEN